MKKYHVTGHVVIDCIVDADNKLDAIHESFELINWGDFKPCVREIKLTAEEAEGND